MSLPPTTQVFETGLKNPASSGLLDHLVRQQLQSLAVEVDMNTPPPSSSSSSSPQSENLIADMGDYFSRTAAIWAQLTERLLKVPQMKEALVSVHERTSRLSSMSNLEEIVKLDVENSRLREIRDLSLKFCQDVQEVWRPPGAGVTEDFYISQTSISPFCDSHMPSVSRTLSVGSDGREMAQFMPRKLLPDKSQFGNFQLVRDESGSEESSDDDDDDDEQFQRIDMEALRQRGKGVYFCPKGQKCDKGGVDKDGNIICFDRNSSFAQHCNKHRKPWRCDVPGCPNPPKKRRFARRDGLERHKATVKHYIVP